MKTLIVIKCINCSGGVANFYKVLNLDKEKNVDYFLQNSNSKKSFIKVITFPAIFIKFFFKTLKYDNVLLNPSMGYTAVWRDMIYLLISKLLNKKVIVFFRGWNEQVELKIKNNKILLFLFKSYNLADSYIVLGEVFINKLTQMGLKDKGNFNMLTTIANDLFWNENAILNKIKSETKKITLLFLSRFVPKKGIFFTIDVFSELRKKYDNINLIMAGDGILLDEAKYYVEKNGIDNVTFTGYVDDKKKHYLLSNASIFIFPTEEEGLPNVVLEAMLYGLPVLTRDVGALKEIVKNEENGFCFEESDLNVFVSACERLIEDKYLYRKIAVNNVNIAKQNFVKEKVKERLLEVLNNV